MSWHPISSNNKIFDGSKGASWSSLDCTTDTSAAATGVPTGTCMVVLKVEEGGWSSVWISFGRNELNVKEESPNAIFISNGSGLIRVLTDPNGAVDWIATATRPGIVVTVIGYLDTTEIYGKTILSEESLTNLGDIYDLESVDSAGDPIGSGGLCFFDVSVKNRYSANKKSRCGCMSLNDDRGRPMSDNADYYNGTGAMFTEAAINGSLFQFTSCSDSSGDLKIEVALEGTIPDPV